jgi:preprotein translocase subunit YajC
MKPYKEEILSENRVIRTFKNDVEEGELTWHRDREDRIIFPINENDWYFQEDNYLPKKMEVGQPIIIESGIFHRVIKGFSDLELDIFKVNLDDKEKVKTNINEIFMLFLEKLEKT